jgi:hypothetical protein
VRCIPAAAAGAERLGSIRSTLFETHFVYARTDSSQDTESELGGACHIYSFPASSSNTLNIEVVKGAKFLHEVY